MKKITTLFLLAYCGLLLSSKSCEKDENITAKESAIECSADDECTEVEDGCCGCLKGGKKKAISKKMAAEYKRDLSEKCQDMMCAQVISDDQSCQKAAACIEGVCSLR